MLHKHGLTVEASLAPSAKFDSVDILYHGFPSAIVLIKNGVGHKKIVPLATKSGSQVDAFVYKFFPAKRLEHTGDGAKFT